MAKRRNFVGSLLIFLILLIMVALIVCAVFELFITPKPENIVNRYNTDDSDTYITVTDKVLGVNVAPVPAATALALYGYSNESITKNVDEFITITYTKEEAGQTIVYSACVIYFASMGDAIDARKGVKDNLKENDKVSMFRGRTLIMGDQKAVLKYYYVLV